MKNILILILVGLIAAAGLWWALGESNVSTPEISVKKAGEMIKDGAEGVVEKVEDGAEAVDSTTGEVMEKVEDGAEGVMEKVEETVSAAGTQLAGAETPTVDENGNELVGGDAVAPAVTPGEKSFTVIGGKFFYDLKEIEVEKGDKVTINFRSNDGFHDWAIDEFDAKTEAVSTGGESSVTFVADKIGEFEYYCSVGNHREMGQVGTLIVTE